jgi:NAD(P)-dependent dehydrogenase (short-subunit alcohol dehydrogenase family)
MADAALVFGVGASAGVGGAVCRRFAREGMTVVAVGRTQEKLDKLADEVRKASGRASGLVADVTSAAEMARAFDRVEKEVGAPPAVVVYNAGNMAAGPIAEMTDAFFEASWRVCAFGDRSVTFPC